MDDDMVCCEWCGDEFPPEEMATPGLCSECIEVAEFEDPTP